MLSLCSWERCNCEIIPIVDEGIGVDERKEGGHLLVFFFILYSIFYILSSYPLCYSFIRFPIIEFSEFMEKYIYN